MKNQKSDSDVQKNAEKEMIQNLSKELGCILESNELKLKKCSVQIDGYSAEGKIICEAYAHIGHLHGSQPDKIASDILKLNLVEKQVGGSWHKILLFADDTVCKQLKGESWLAEVCKDSQIEIRIVNISEETKKKLENAQRTQKMVNAE